MRIANEKEGVWFTGITRETDGPIRRLVFNFSNAHEEALVYDTQEEAEADLKILKQNFGPKFAIK